MLNKFKQFVDELLKENGSNYKKSILEKYKEDKDILYLLDFLYNPYIITGISTKKLNKKFENFDKILEEHFDQRLLTAEGEADVLKGLLNYLQTHNTGTDTDIKMVQQYRYLWFSENAELFDKIVTKNLPLGIDAKTINKVIPGLIPEFNVMLANKYFDNPSIVEGKEFALTTKIDGGRIIAMKCDGEVTFYTRAGQKYEGLVDLQNELENLTMDNFVFDGELTLLDPGKLTSKDQYKETMKISRKDGEKYGLRMLVFDFMPVRNFLIQNCLVDYRHRRAELSAIFDLNEFKYFKLLPILYKGNDTSEIIKWLNYNIEHGEEGVMINFLDSVYEFKRSNALLKVKKMNDLDLEIIGFEEGTNKNAGKLGAILVNYKDNVVKVGSGFSDELREEIWQNQDKWLGRTVVIQYFEETCNQNGGISLRFPVYLDYRTDK